MKVIEGPEKWTQVVTCLCCKSKVEVELADVRMGYNESPSRCHTANASSARAISVSKKRRQLFGA
jgi:hypothetical protein